MKKRKQELVTKIQKLSSGTSNIEESSLKAKEICSILKACKRAGVTELKFAGLEISFAPKTSKVETLATDGVFVAPVSGKYAVSSTAKTDEGEDKQMSLGSVSNSEAMQDILDQLAIDDPLAHEKMLLNADIEQHRMMNGQA